MKNIERRCGAVATIEPTDDELVAQQVRASLPGLSCAERPVFEPRLDHDLFIILPRYVSVRSLNLSISPPHRLHGNEQNKVKKRLATFK